MLDVTSSDACIEIRVAVLGEWVPSQLAEVLALQRAEEPETAAALVDCVTAERADVPPGGRFDFAVSTNELQWPGWICEPLWHDTLAVAVAKRSHLLIHREVPCHELLRQPLISAQSTAGEPWRAEAHRLLEDAEKHGKRVGTFEQAMTLVAAGYGITIAPAARLAGYQCRGIAVRPLAGTLPIVMAYLLHPCTALTEPQERFARRVRSVS
jgi:DNA-binding transcriptional LysR family regulator